MKTNSFEKNSYWIGIALTIVFLLMLILTCRSQSNWAGVSVGATDMAKIYVGENLVWEKPSSCTGLTIGGECYDTITIGTQTWLDRNLHYTDSGAGIYSYNGEADSSAIYGYLYTWDAAMRLDAAIAGWHLPSDAEWQTLSDYLGGDDVAGGKLKETGTDHWTTPNTGATNESGFTALPGGYRYDNGTFNYIGYYGYWWSATENTADNAWYRYVHYYRSYVDRDNYNKELGFSVRLIKD